MTDNGTVVLPSSLVEDILAYVTARHPRKSFGYLAAAPGHAQPTEFVAFDDNVRNDDRWRRQFESRGRYFVDHWDAGFVATEDESWRVQRYLMSHGLSEVAMFHTHRRHPGNFSDIDYDLHISRFATMWHLIISLRNVELPQLRAFAVSEHGVGELRVSITPRPVPTTAPTHDATGPWRAALTLDGHGLPRCRDSAAVLDAINGLARFPDQYREYVTEGFLRHAEDRYQEYVAPSVTGLAGGTFAMGTDPADARHFCGETPRHRVALSPFPLSRQPVTNEIYALFDPSRSMSSAAERHLPVVGVSWFDAALCAAWLGCRLPTEAEWEYACGAGSPGQWCCPAGDLPDHAWYSETAGQRPHPVGTREPNSFGLCDMPGNVWEWCQDTYFPDYYGRSRVRDPVADAGGGTSLAPSPHKVARGGGFLALAEMCRSRYRLHDPAGYSAGDLGFRLARNSSADSGGG